MIFAETWLFFLRDVRVTGTRLDPETGQLRTISTWFQTTNCNSYTSGGDAERIITRRSARCKLVVEVQSYVGQILEDLMLRMLGVFPKHGGHLEPSNVVPLIEMNQVLLVDHAEL